MALKHSLRNMTRAEDNFIDSITKLDLSEYRSNTNRNGMWWTIEHFLIFINKVGMMGEGHYDRCRQIDAALKRTLSRVELIKGANQWFTSIGTEDHMVYALRRLRLML